MRRAKTGSSFREIKCSVQDRGSDRALSAAIAVRKSVQKAG